MTEAYRRVMSLFSAEETAKIKRVVGRICFVQPPAIQIIPEVWQAVFEAVRDDQRLELAYQKSSDSPPAKRRFDAYGVIVRDRDWYLYGFCHLRKAPLTLAFANIKSAELIDEFFEIPKGFDLRKYTEDGFQGLQSDGMPNREIVLRFCPEVAESVSARPWSLRQKIIKESSGHLRISFQTSALYRVEREVLSWGDKVEVLKPVELRKRIFAIATSLSGIYK